MKKRHGVFFGFAVLLITAIFTLVGCDNGGGGNDEPELAKWAGTWNAIDQYLDDAQLSQIWTDGASYINTNFAGKNATANNLKGLFKYMLKTDFKSCVIADDTMKIYNTLNASGSPSATIVYTYKGSGEGEYSDWSKFEGNTVGQFKYLLVNPRHQDNPGSMEHFHLQYNAESFDKATENPMWVATVTPTSTTITAIKEELETLFEEFPWDQIPAEMLAQFN
jgi:Zn/Cd-binding protein ZinT